jgi:Bacterial SH3 domain
VLGQSSTMLSIVAPPAEVATTGSIEASETSAAQAEPQPPSADSETSAAQAEPQPPSADQAAAQSAPTAEDGSAPIVNTVKTVAVDPPAETLPHDGASALGEAAEKPQAPAEWMQTKTAVDMHARAEQKSDTVKVAEGGLKVRVTARDKNWVQVQDPKSGTTGWIYNRFLTAADAPAE